MQSVSAAKAIVAAVAITGIALSGGAAVTGAADKPDASASGAMVQRTGAGAGRSGTSPHATVEGDVPRAPTDAEVQIAVDPGLARGRAWDIEALRAEARGKGRMTLVDGDVLRGRVVMEGLDIAEGALVFIAAGTQIISIGDMHLDGALVPFVDGSTTEDSNQDRGVKDGAAKPGTAKFGAMTVAPGSGTIDAKAIDTESAGSLVAPGDDPADGLDVEVAALAVNCNARNDAIGVAGMKPAPIDIVFVGRAVVTGAFAQICAGPLADQIPSPPLVASGGASITSPGARAVGGRGGDGIDVTIEGLGNSTLAIRGPLCNGRGADGAKAVASAADGGACLCGGDAEATGGDGGDGGKLVVIADTIIWNVALASLTVQSGGVGGGADATAGNGGFCPCPGDGGRGGDAAAKAGSAGKPGRVRVAARQNMVPPAAFVLANLVSFGPSPQGGTANAFAGLGAGSGQCLSCDPTVGSGGAGGDGGDATAIGGDGGDGFLLVATQLGVIVAVRGSDGGDGGGASATGKQGGNGGNAAPCPCPAPGWLQGGDGGDGGSGTAIGGKGGAANGGPPSIALAIAKSGDGGDGDAFCGQGGPGGAGGSCGPGFFGPCVAGGGGDGGMGGLAFETGGAAGAASGAALPGAAGAPAPPGTTTTCLPGNPGPPGLQLCIGGAACCVPGNAPGCPDPFCKEAVCTVDPFCCQEIWDQGCADQAIVLCPICMGAGDCCIAHNGPGCNDPSCQTVVCFVNPACCDLQWDQFCANLASQMCDACPGTS
ncbi:MAG: hypothetical protein U0575_09675 [Phycisphaerales bacterium]